MQTQDAKGLNTQQAAEYLNSQYSIPVTKGTMEVWRCLGKGPRYRKVQRWTIYTTPDLDHFAGGRVVETVDSYSGAER